MTQFENQKITPQTRSDWLWLKNRREIFKRITKRGNRNCEISFHSYLKTAPLNCNRKLSSLRSHGHQVAMKKLAVPFGPYVVPKCLWTPLLNKSERC